MSAVDRRGAPDPLGTVAVMFSSGTGRYSQMFKTLNDLKTPEGTVKTFWSANRVQDLNDIVTEALNTRSYWIWFISEEYGFGPDVLNTLLSRNEAMVAPIVLEAEDPYLPTAWVDYDEKKGQEPLRLNQVIGPASLVDVRGANVTGMLVRRAVFEAMSPPWFRHVSEIETEDVYFCERAREVGFNVFVDTETRLSTLQVASVLPRYAGGRWELGIDVGSDMFFSKPLKQT